MREIITIDIDKITYDIEPSYYLEPSYYIAYDELKKSINDIGLKVPISVRDNNYSYKIIDGRLRYLACRELGHKTIDCHVMLSTDFDIMVEQIIPSQSRVETSPEEYAKHLANILKHMTIEELSKNMGESVQWIEEKLSLVQET